MGGAIYAAGVALTLDTVTLDGNSASSLGGALLVGTDLRQAGASYATFRDNDANYGGGVFSHFSGLKINNSAVIRNTADTDGGGLYVHEGLVTLLNSTLSGNQAKRDGAGIFVKYGSLQSGSVTISNNTADADDNGDGIAGGLYQYNGGGR